MTFNLWCYLILVSVHAMAPQSKRFKLLRWPTTIDFKTKTSMKMFPLLRTGRVCCPPSIFPAKCCCFMCQLVKSGCTCRGLCRMCLLGKCGPTTGGALYDYNDHLSPELCSLRQGHSPETPQFASCLKLGFCFASSISCWNWLTFSKRFSSSGICAHTGAKWQTRFCVTLF